MSVSVRSLSTVRATTLGLPLVIAAGILWGTGGIAGNVLQHGGLSAAGVGLWRLGAAAVVLIGWHAVAGSLDRLLVEQHTLRRLLGNGVLLAGFQACYFAGVPLLGVGIATLVTLGSAPVMVAIAHAVRQRAIPSGRTCGALVLAVLGLVAVVVGGGSTNPSSGGHVLGLVWCLVSAGGFAALTVRQQRIISACPALTSVTIVFSSGALVLLPVAVLAGPVLPAVDTRSVGLVLYLGLLPTALAYAAYFAGLARVSATSAAVTAMLEPITAGVLSLVLLGERLGPLAVAGSLAVVAAIALGAERRLDGRTIG